MFRSKVITDTFNALISINKLKKRDVKMTLRLADGCIISNAKHFKQFFDDLYFWLDFLSVFQKQYLEYHTTSTLQFT